MRGWIRDTDGGRCGVGGKRTRGKRKLLVTMAVEEWDVGLKRMERDSNAGGLKS